MRSGTLLMTAILLLVALVHGQGSHHRAVTRDWDRSKFTTVVSVDPYRAGWKQTCTYDASGYRVSCFSWRLLKVSPRTSRPDVRPYYGYAQAIHA